MTLYASSEALTKLVGSDNDGYIRVSDKIYYCGDLKGWSRANDASYTYLDKQEVYTKQDGEYCVEKFIYDENGDLYVVSAGEMEYYYYVKSYDNDLKTITVSYDTYDNIKNETLSDSAPLGEENIVYERNEDLDKNL